MAEIKPNATPIPPIKKDDAEDVSWALSTAEAMWNRGDRTDAVKWIRRAAEAASEAQEDDRALELAKAAADLAAHVGPIPATAPPPPVAVAPVPRIAPAPPPSTPSRPPPPPPAAGRAPAPIARTTAAPSPAKVAGPTQPRAPMTAKGFAPTPPAKPTVRGRKSHANLTEEAKRAVKAVAIANADETTQTNVVPEAPRRRARSKPSADEITPPAPAAVPVIAAPRPAAGRPPELEPATPSTDDMDQWPTQSLLGDDLDEPNEEKTRIGSPAYQEAAKRSAPPPAMTAAPIPTMQAVRVIVFQAADGIRVAPHGTAVTGIAVEALLVASDPATDLASWLAARRG